MKYLFIIASFALLSLSPIHTASGQHQPYDRYLDHPWVDSVMSSLSLRQQAAQLVWISASAGIAPARHVAVDHLIREQGIGGMVFSHVSERQFRSETEYYRSVSDIPMAAGIIYESSEETEPEIGQHSGLLDGFPGPMALNAVRNDSLLSRAGRELAARLISVGLQLLLEPAGEKGAREAGLSRTLMGHGVLLATADYPERGGSDLEKELAGMPGFRGMISADQAGAAGLAFLFEPDETEVGMAIGRIVSLVETGSLDREMLARRARMMLAFKYWAGLESPSGRAAGSPKGLIAQSMQTRDVLAVQGTQTRDVLAVQGTQTRDENSWKALIRDLYAGALTVLNNREELIPLGNLESTSVATVTINQTALTPFIMPAATQFHQPALTPFQQMAGNYTRMDHYHWIPGMDQSEPLLQKLQQYDLVLAAIYPGDTRLAKEVLGKMVVPDSGTRRLIAVSFEGIDGPGSNLSPVTEADGAVIAYAHNPFTEELAAQLIFGGIGARGRLPVAVSGDYPAGSGINTQGDIRLQYAFPESAGISSRILESNIDSIVHAGLEAGAFPGCEVMAARQGKVIFHKTYGHHTYERRVEVSEKDLYDLASVTKISAPLSGLMVLEGRGRFYHRDRLGTYAPAMKRSDKADLLLTEVLAHQAGLYPWIPYWRDAVRVNGTYKHRFLRYSGDQKYPVVVADHLYLKHNFKKRIHRTIRKSELGEKEYLYSGLAFFLFPEIIEDLSGDRYEDFLYRQVYHRIGAWDLVFNPWRYYPMSRIVPTEYDSLFRKQQIHGYVHDEGAAMMGGYSGNAGLFATANDLMKLMEMYRRMGSYGGEVIIPAGVLQEYTSYQFPDQENRRGLGFDKPLLDERDGTPGDYPCPGASPSSFGHSGFTGTFAWIDPEYEITYVFLSNRVHPTRENNLISEMDIRTSILQSLYDAIGTGR